MALLMVKMLVMLLASLWLKRDCWLDHQWVLLWDHWSVNMLVAALEMMKEIGLGQRMECLSFSIQLDNLNYFIGKDL